VNGIPNGNGNPMEVETNDKIGNGNGKEWEAIYMRMTVIPIGINIPIGDWF